MYYYEIKAAWKINTDAQSLHAITWTVVGVTEQFYLFTFLLFVQNASLKSWGFFFFVCACKYWYSLFISCLPVQIFCAFCPQKMGSVKEREASQLQHMVPRLNNKMNVSWIQLGTGEPHSAHEAQLNDWKTRIQSKRKERLEQERRENSTPTLKKTNEGELYFVHLKLDLH